MDGGPAFLLPKDGPGGRSAVCADRKNACTRAARRRLALFSSLRILRFPVCVLRGHRPWVSHVDLTSSTRARFVVQVICLRCGMHVDVPTFQIIGSAA
jgi:hypothetical protein